MEQQALTRGVMGEAEKAANEGLAEFVDGAHVVAATYDQAKDVVVLDVVFIQHATLEIRDATLTAADWREQVVQGGRATGKALHERISGRLHVIAEELEA